MSRNAQIDIFRRYLKSRPYEIWPDGKSLPMTLESFLAAQDDRILPQRHAKDIRPLKALLSGADATISGKVLRQKLGQNYRMKYSTRDWTDTMEAVLQEQNPMMPIRFGKEYRIIFNEDRDGGISVVLLNEKLIHHSKSRKRPPNLKLNIH